ncbi:Thioredoxin reductase [Cupriavidus necator]|uniref:Cyclic nucleotide-binding domain-containing protein n=1 Tax=Cupriavidus necator (strain ATCC 17699 / DSM 428 / KCTC 22496 / NCIMB 10442 / H16 / Stanier 337) TaxID=381666 RepID=Q0KAT0_CUPNH|nr:FAD-dependent oxidoreductase [Cupriavidus necator]QCC00750.1 cyclic nucleotide-binding domain-containing protein [Cupriavidus necator H16]QQB76426.1 FAD-dependent oxidoreductase [Cupriavidus necator]WKA42634.1 FAD-dependent oxidoreductase [Cupriavidus necator]CAJ92891.1 thioredoxin reductase [Cupriavidus necator H16]
MSKDSALGARGVSRPAASTCESSAIEEDASVREHPRYQQMFPVLTDEEVARVCRFGNPCHYVKGDFLYRAGSICPGVFIILSGKVRIVIRDGLSQQRILHTYTMRGEFTSDITQLSSKPAVVDAHVIEDVEAVLLRPDELSAMIVNEAGPGDKIMRALILRRVLAIERGRGVVFVAAPGNARLLELQNFLRRNAFPNLTLDAEEDAEAIALLQRLTPQPDDFPLVVCPDGTVLRNPDVGQLASCLGLIPDFNPAHVYDVAIIGAGPGGLAAAVYASSDGLSAAVFDCRAPGGQAGTSARIENYLGFPTGITGQDLASRAFIQAQKFGAHIGIPCEVKALYCDRHPLAVELADHRRISARTVVIASGAEYRRPVVDGLERFERCGVYYWATPIEARLCRNEPVLLLGGGNSAGQAAVFLASHAEHVHMFIRGSRLADSMSRYLIERIGSLENLTLHTGTELTALEGGVRLERVHYRGAGGIEGSMTTHHLFVFIGALPNTDWLRRCGVVLDGNGFVLTGADVSEASLLPLQTSVDGVFAIGDVRSGSTKRVASAVGEGAAVVAQIHQFLSPVRPAQRERT